MTDTTPCPDHDLPAMSIEEFSRRHGIGRTMVYGEINEGRLRAVKCGKRTLVLMEDAERWRQSLAEFTPRPAA